MTITAATSTHTHHTDTTRTHTDQRHKSSTRTHQPTTHTTAHAHAHIHHKTNQSPSRFGSERDMHQGSMGVLFIHPVRHAKRGVDSRIRDRIRVRRRERESTRTDTQHTQQDTHTAPPHTQTRTTPHNTHHTTTQQRNHTHARRTRSMFVRTCVQHELRRRNTITNKVRINPQRRRARRHIHRQHWNSIQVNRAARPRVLTCSNIKPSNVIGERDAIRDDEHHTHTHTTHFKTTQTDNKPHQTTHAHTTQRHHRIITTTKCTHITHRTHTTR